MSSEQKPFLLVHRDDGWWITGPGVELGPYRTPGEAKNDPQAMREYLRVQGA